MKIAVDGTEHTVCTTNDNILHRKLESTPLRFHRSAGKDVSPKKHTLSGPGRKNLNVSEKAQKNEERTISASKSKIRKVESNENESDFDCYNKKQQEARTCRHRQRSHFTERRPALALPPNKLEEQEINNNGETKGGNGNISVRRFNPTFRPPDRVGYLLFFQSNYQYLQDQPEKTTKTQTDDNLGNGLGRRVRSQWRQVTDRRRWTSYVELR